MSFSPDKRVRGSPGGRLALCTANLRLLRTLLPDLLKGGANDRTVELGSLPRAVWSPPRATKRFPIREVHMCQIRRGNRKDLVGY